MSRHPPKQNLSGHVCFDVPQTRFFQEVNAKVHKLELKRRGGVYEERRDRNPLAAEKSPRRNEAFEYRPPPAPLAKERWVYPEGDWGLMAKFRSQKHIYDEIQAKEKLYEQQVSQVAWIREENQRKIREEFERQKNLYAAAKKSKEESDQKRFSAIMSTDLAGGDKQSGGHHNHSNGPDELDLALAREARVAAAAQAERIRKKKDHSSLLVLKKESTPPTDFYHTKISSFRTIGDKHPEVLAEWRAKRAAEFVSENVHTLEVPKARALGRSFRPGGILPAKPKGFTFSKEAPVKKKPAPLLKPIDPSQLDVDVLKKTLRETEVEIERQQLKIKLNAKPPKRYEVGRDERIPANARELRRDSL